MHGPTMCKQVLTFQLGLIRNSYFVVPQKNNKTKMKEEKQQKQQKKRTDASAQAFVRIPNHLADAISAAKTMETVWDGTAKSFGKHHNQNYEKQNL